MLIQYKGGKPGKRTRANKRGLPPLHTYGRFLSWDHFSRSLHFHMQQQNNQRVSNLVFYAQSISTVISGRCTCCDSSHNNVKNVYMLKLVYSQILNWNRLKKWVKYEQKQNWCKSSIMNMNLLNPSRIRTAPSRRPMPASASQRKPSDEAQTANKETE